MIKVFQIALLLLVLGSCAAQVPEQGQLVLKTTIKWEDREKVMLPDTAVLKDEAQIPFLVFTIENQTGKAVYFPKPVISDEWQLPRINGGLDVTEKLESTDTSLSLSSLYHDYEKSRFDVFFEGLTEYSGGLSLLEPTVEEGDEVEYPVINTELAAFYNIVSTQYKLDMYKTGRQLAYFSDPDKEVITYKEAQKILKLGENETAPVLQFDELNTKAFNIRKNTSQFIFLKAGETYRVELNLIGFKLCNAIYEFKLKESEFNGFVYGSAQWDDTQKKWLRSKIALPPQVDDYHLFKGTISSTTVVFDSDKVID